MKQRSWKKLYLSHLSICRSASVDEIRAAFVPFVSESDGPEGPVAQ